MRANLYVTSSIIRLLLLSLVAGTLSIYLFEELELERRLSSRVLLELPKGSSYLSLYNDTSNPGCFGSISYSLTDENDQITISTRAWLALSIEGKERIHNVACDLYFNALGQFGTSLCTTEIEGTEIRLGTTHVDPITLHVYVGRESTTPVMEQNFPGPITVASYEGRYAVTAPFNSGLALPSLSDLSSFAPLPHVTTKREACSVASRSSLPVSLTTLKNLSQKATNLIPKGLL